VAKTKQAIIIAIVDFANKIAKNNMYGKNL
jgi:hypothetical protein